MNTRQKARELGDNSNQIQDNLSQVQSNKNGQDKLPVTHYVLEHPRVSNSEQIKSQNTAAPDNNRSIVQDRSRRLLQLYTTPENKDKSRIRTRSTSPKRRESIKINRDYESDDDSLNIELLQYKENALKQKQSSLQKLNRQLIIEETKSKPSPDTKSVSSGEKQLQIASPIPNIAQEIELSDDDEIFHESNADLISIDILEYDSINPDQVRVVTSVQNCCTVATINLLNKPITTFSPIKGAQKGVIAESSNSAKRDVRPKTSVLQWESYLQDSQLYRDSYLRETEENQRNSQSNKYHGNIPYYCSELLQKELENYVQNQVRMNTQNKFDLFDDRYKGEIDLQRNKRKIVSENHKEGDNCETESQPRKRQNTIGKPGKVGNKFSQEEIIEKYFQNNPQKSKSYQSGNLTMAQKLCVFTNVDLPKFKGDMGQDPVKWGTSFLEFMRCNGWGHDEALNSLPMYLKGSALEWFRNLPTQITDGGIPAIIAALARYFNNDRVKHIFNQKFTTLKQAKDESVEKFCDRINDIASRLDKDNDAKLQAFMGGLLPHLKMQVIIRQLGTYQEAINFALLLEAITPEVENDDSDKPKTKSTEKVIASLDDKFNERPMESMIEAFKSAFHIENVDNIKNQNRPDSKPQCTFCGRIGHTEMSCWTKNRPGPMPMGQQQQQMPIQRDFNQGQYMPPQQFSRNQFYPNRRFQRIQRPFQQRNQYGNFQRESYGNRGYNNNQYQNQFLGYNPNRGNFRNNRPNRGFYSQNRRQNGPQNNQSQNPLSNGQYDNRNFPQQDHNNPQSNNNNYVRQTNASSGNGYNDS